MTLRTVQAVAEADRPAGPSNRALVVDEGTALLHLVYEALCEVRPAWVLERVSSPAEALDRMASQAPAVLVSEHRAPDVDAVDLFARARAAGHMLPMVIISSEPAPALDGVAAGRVELLQRPVGARRLEAVILALVGKAHSPAA